MAPKRKGARKSPHNITKYYDYDDIKHQGIRDTGNLFGKDDEDYYKPVKAKSAFDGNYIKYESKRDKDKDLWPKEYLDIITPCLRDMINSRKTRREWKIQLTMQINFVSHKDSEETGIMYGVIQKVRNAKKQQFYPPPSTPHCNELSYFLWYPPH